MPWRPPAIRRNNALCSFSDHALMPRISRTRLECFSQLFPQLSVRTQRRIKLAVNFPHDAVARPGRYTVRQQLIYLCLNRSENVPDRRRICIVKKRPLCRAPRIAWRCRRRLD